MTPHLLGIDEAGRSLYTLQVAGYDELPRRLELASPHYALFLAGDATGVSSDAIGVTAHSYLESGAVYVCVWGPDCERVHDIFDEIDVQREIEHGTDYNIMTTWHDGESLSEAVAFFKRLAIPDPAFSESCRSYVAVAVGGLVSETEIRVALNDA